MRINRLTDDQVAGTCLSEGHGAVRGGLRAKLNELIDAINAITTEDVKLYVSPSGSDEDGDGSVSKPYKTITYAYEQVPYVIKHTVRILIAAGAYTAFPALIENSFRDLGSLAFIGVGAPIEVLAEVTLTGKADLGTGGHTFTASGESWDVSAYTGLFMEVTSGASAGKAMPILNNTADTLICPRRDSGVPGIGDKVRVIKPSVVAQCDRITLRSQGEVSWDASWNAVPISLLNIDFDMTGFATATVDFKDGMYQLQLVGFEFNDGGYEPLEIQGASINRWTAIDTGAGALTGSGISNLNGAVGNNPGFAARRATPGAGANGVIAIGYPRGAHGEICEFVGLDSCVVQGYSNWQYCGVRRTHVISSESMFNYCLHDVAGAVDGAGGYANSRLWLSKCHFMGATVASIQVGFRAVIYDCTHEASTPYGATIAANNTVNIDQASKTGLAGNTADIKWLGPAPDTTGTWPAEGAQATDGIGASVVGVA